MLKGFGISVVGLKGRVVEEELVPGMGCIVEPMCPHHFTTSRPEALEVLPLHVLSPIGGVEQNHPMFSGTYLADASARRA